LITLKFSKVMYTKVHVEMNIIRKIKISYFQKYLILMVNLIINIILISMSKENIICKSCKIN